MTSEEYFDNIISTLANEALEEYEKEEGELSSFGKRYFLIGFIKELNDKENPTF